jgi:hypothetical protein
MCESYFTAAELSGVFSTSHPVSVIMVYEVIEQEDSMAKHIGKEVKLKQ